jgi:TolB-like protein
MYFRCSVISVTAFLFMALFPSLARAQSDLGNKVAALAEKLASSNEGRVVSAAGDTLYLDIGREHGILDGNIFEIVRLGEPIKVGDEIIGYEEQIIAKAETYRVRKKITIAKLVEKSEVPKAGDRAYQLKKRIKRLAVSQFTYNDGFNVLTKNLQDKLFTDLVQNGMQVVERNQLERVLQEQKLGYSGLVDLGSAKKVGALLGAEGMVLGTINDLGNSLSINARLIDLETGNSISAAEMEIPKTPIISAMLEEPLESGSFTVQPAKEKPAIVQKKGELKEAVFAKNKKKGLYFSLTLHSKQINKDGQLLLHFLITPEAGNKYGNTDRLNRTYLTDKVGNLYPVNDASAFAYQGVPGITRRFTLIFDKYPTDICNAVIYVWRGCSSCSSDTFTGELDPNQMTVKWN